MEQKQAESARELHGEAAVLELLREDVEQAETEASLAAEAEALILLEVKEYQRQHQELNSEVRPYAGGSDTVAQLLCRLSAACVLPI